MGFDSRRLVVEFDSRKLIWRFNGRSLLVGFDSRMLVAEFPLLSQSLSRSIGKGCPSAARVGWYVNILDQA